MKDFLKSLRRLKNRDLGGIYLSNATITDLENMTKRASDKVIAFFKTFSEVNGLIFKQDTSGIHICRYEIDLG